MKDDETERISQRSIKDEVFQLFKIDPNYGTAV